MMGRVHGEGCVKPVWVAALATDGVIVLIEESVGLVTVGFKPEVKGGNLNLFGVMALAMDAGAVLIEGSVGLMRVAKVVGMEGNVKLVGVMTLVMDGGVPMEST